VKVLLGVHEEKFLEKGSVTAEAVSVPTPMQSRSTASRTAQKRRKAWVEDVGVWVFMKIRINEGRNVVRTENLSKGNVLGANS
jgi:hypothetical protein